jgi:DNA-binding IscR family transcriptional regulator
VLHILVKHNFLDSHRGPNGGFTIKKDPGSITLLEIYELIEGEIVGFECTITCSACYFDTCIFGNYPHTFTGDFKHYLGNKTLVDFSMNKNI